MRRNLLNIYAAILEVCQHKPVKTTHVMYKANVNCTLLNKEYLPVLVKNELLSAINTSTRKQKRTSYQTTKKGKAWLAKYYTLLEAVDIECKHSWWRNDT